MDSVTLLIIVAVAAIALGGGFAYGKLSGERAVTAERDRANALQGQVDLLTSQKQSLEQYKTNSEALNQMLQPMREAVDKLGRDAQETEKKQIESTAQLRQQIVNMNAQASELQATQKQLVGALTSSASRGRWGEMQLERLFEYAGMERGVHYFPQSTGESDTGRGRPDFVVKLANGGVVYVDSKFPFDAYWSGLSTTDESQRAEFMKAHARAVKDRVRELSKRSYQAQSDSSADFAVLFLPFESLYYSALEVEPDLLTDVFAQNVVIATPSTMMGLLHTIKLGISQANTAENAAHIRQVAIEMLDRFAVFAEFLVKVDKNLASAVDSLDKLKASYTSRLLPSVRRMQALGVEGKKAIPEVSSGALDDLDALEVDTSISMNREMLD